MFHIKIIFCDGKGDGEIPVSRVTNSGDQPGNKISIYCRIDSTNKINHYSPIFYFSAPVLGAVTFVAISPYVLRCRPCFLEFAAARCEFLHRFLLSGRLFLTRRSSNYAWKHSMHAVHIPPQPNLLRRRQAAVVIVFEIEGHHSLVSNSRLSV